MNDQGWAALVGLAVFIAMRLLDYFIPKGYMWKGTRNHSVRVEEDDEDGA